MTHQIILLILVAFLPVLPFIYRKAGRRWTKFYLGMAMREQNRKTFVLVMAVLILSVNFLQYRISGPDLWLVPGFICGLLVLRFNWVDAVLRWIHKDRMLQLFALAFFFLVSMDARLFTLAVAFALIIDFSFFYPSGFIIDMARTEPEALKSMSDEEIRNHYF
ncbi:MAG: hypothetical protein Q4G10_08595 [Bacteroidia bacterium]|nr:hypothetical protein [Bacteroidia bacterium]